MWFIYIWTTKYNPVFNELSRFVFKLRWLWRTLITCWCPVWLLAFNLVGCGSVTSWGIALLYTLLWNIQLFRSGTIFGLTTLKIVWLKWLSWEWQFYSETLGMVCFYTNCFRLVDYDSIVSKSSSNYAIWFNFPLFCKPPL